MKTINKDFFDQIGRKIAGTAQSGIDASKRVAETAKLKAANFSEEEAIKRAYLEIGKLYYAEHGEAPDGPYVALCSRISQSRDTITKNLTRIEELKTEEDVSEEDFDDQRGDAPDEVPVETETFAEENPPAEEVITAEDVSAPEEAPIPEEE